MPSLAVAMIVKNEEVHLEAALKTVVDWADEVVILDSGSTDRTREIAESHGVRFFANTEWPGFGPQRQLAQQKVRSEWVLWLDADERVTPELRDNLLQVMQSPDESAVYRVARYSWAFGHFIRHCGWYPDYVARLYKVEKTGYDDALVHEKVVLQKGMKYRDLSGDLLHYTYDNLKQYQQKCAAYTHAWAEQRYRRGKKTTLFNAVLHGLGTFLRKYVFQAGVLDGRAGFLICITSAYYTFLKYASLWVMHQPGRGE